MVKDKLLEVAKCSSKVIQEYTHYHHLTQVQWTGEMNSKGHGICVIVLFRCHSHVLRFFADAREEDSTIVH